MKLKGVTGKERDNNGNMVEWDRVISGSDSGHLLPMDADRNGGEGTTLLPETGKRPPCCKRCQVPPAMYECKNKHLETDSVRRRDGGVCRNPERWEGQEERPPCYVKPMPPTSHKTEGYTPRRVQRAIKKMIGEVIDNEKD